MDLNAKKPAERGAMRGEMRITVRRGATKGKKGTIMRIRREAKNENENLEEEENRAQDPKRR